MMWRARTNGFDSRSERAFEAHVSRRTFLTLDGWYPFVHTVTHFWIAGSKNVRSDSATVYMLSGWFLLVVYGALRWTLDTDTYLKHRNLIIGGLRFGRVALMSATLSMPTGRSSENTVVVSLLMIFLLTLYTVGMPLPVRLHLPLQLVSVLVFFYQCVYRACSSCGISMDCGIRMEVVWRGLAVFSRHWLGFSIGLPNRVQGLSPYARCGQVLFIAMFVFGFVWPTGILWVFESKSRKHFMGNSVRMETKMSAGVCGIVATGVIALWQLLLSF